MKARESYASKVEAYLTKGSNAPEVESDAAAMIDSLDGEMIDAIRSAPSQGRPTNAETLARKMSNQQLADAAGRVDARKAVFRGKDLEESTLSEVYRLVLSPFIWLWKLPMVSDKHAKSFAKHAAAWAKVYIPHGLPLLDHLVLLGSFMRGLVDCFRRKKKGEVAHWGAATPKPSTDGEGEDNATGIAA